MSELMTAVFNLMLAIAKAEADDTEDTPPLFEDEIAEILNEHKGEEILIHFNPEGPLRYRYYNYDKDKSIVFAIYNALENHDMVTVSGTNIIDL
jgi:hypothetical protein